MRRFDGITNQLVCEEWCEVTLGNLPMWLMSKNYLMQYILLEATYLRSASCINPLDNHMGLGANAAAAGLEAAASCNPDTGGMGDLEATNVMTTGDEGYSPDLQQQQHEQQQRVAAAAAAAAVAGQAQAAAAAAAVAVAAGAGMVGPSSPSAAAAAAYAAAAVARDAAAMAAAAAAAAEALGRHRHQAAGRGYTEDPSSSRQQTFTHAGFMPVLPPTTTAPAGAGRTASGGVPSQLPGTAGGVSGGVPEQSGGYRGGLGGLGGYPPGGGSGSRAFGLGPQGTSSSSSSEDAAAYA